MKNYYRTPLGSIRILSILLLFFCFTASGQKGQLLGKSEWGPIHLDTCYSSGKEESSHIYKNPFWKKIASQGGKMNSFETEVFETMRTATIVIEFGDGFDELGDDAQIARDAFRFAADIWETEVVSVVPIIISADFASLGAGVLGQNGSPSVTDVPNAPDPTTNYTLALANAIAGVDLSPGTPNGNQTYNLDFDFYFGTDGNTPAGITDFTTVVLHEIGHSMGISGISNGGTGVGNNGGANPRSWDLLVELGDGTPILDLGFGTTEQQAALVSSDLFINGPLAVAALGGQRPEIYAPATFSGGSSFSHWDENTFPSGDPNSLMTPFVGSGESNFNIGDITRGVLADQGWQLSSDLETQDVGIALITSPVSDSDLDSNEVIEVSIRNFGIEEVAAGFEVSYIIDGGAPVTEVVTEAIPPVSLVTFQFATTADLSLDSTTYAISAFTTFTGDQDSSNDSTISIVSNLVPTADLLTASLEYGNVGVGNSVALSATLANISSGDFAGEVDIIDLSVGSGLFVADDLADLPLTIEVGETIDLSFIYTPLALEVNSAIATIITNAGSFDVALSGTGTEPSDIMVSPLALNSVLDLGASESQTIQVTNEGVATLNFDLTFSDIITETTPESVAAPAIKSNSKKVTTSFKSIPSVKTISKSSKLLLGEVASLNAEDAVYTIDDGTEEGSIGLNEVNELMWLNAFQVAPGANVITSISSTVSVGAAETPARFILYNDPDNDGDPANAVFLTEASGILTNPGENIFTTVTIDPTPVEGVFFVAVLIDEDPNVNPFPMPQDTDSPTQQSSWAISDSDGDFDVNDLSNNTLPPLLIDDADLPGNWLLRADGQFFSANPTSASLVQGESTDVQVDFFGTSPGLFSSLININSNDPDEPVVAVEATMEVDGVLVTVSPEELVESIAQGSTSTQVLTLNNGGASDITFDIAVNDLGVVIPEISTALASKAHIPVSPRTTQYAGNSFANGSKAIAGGAIQNLGTVQYETGFEDFATGDIEGQNGWTGQFTNWTIETINPLDGALHYRGLSDGLGQTLSFSPSVEIGTEDLSSVRMDIEIVGIGTTWDIIPQSPTAASVNTRLRFNPDGSVSALVNDPVLGGVYETFSTTTPSGYFSVAIEVERATNEFDIFFDGELVFEGAGFAGDIEQLVMLSLMEVAGPTFDMENVAIIDGDAQGFNSSFVTPQVLTGVIPGGGSLAIDVLFDANLDFGTYSAELAITLNNNSLIPELIVPAQLTVEGPALLEVSPVTIIEEVNFQSSSTNFITLENTGGEVITYDLSIIGGAVNALQTGESLVANESLQFMDLGRQKKLAFDQANTKNKLVSGEQKPVFAVIGNAILEESFEGDVFPPAGWTVVDNEDTGVIWEFASFYGDTNYTSGTGEAATVNSDAFGVAEYDTELRTPIIDISGKSDLFIQYNANYINLANLDFLDLDISIDEGETWTNILQWNENHGGFFSQPGEQVTQSLDEFVTGATTMVLRWRYYNPNQGDWDWYVQIDDVVIFEEAEMWLSIEEPTGQIPVGTTIDIPVNFDAALLDAGDFEVAGIVVSSNATDNPEVGVIAAIDVRTPPVAEISVDFLVEKLIEGEVSLQDFTITNTGESDLTFDFQDIFFNADLVTIASNRRDPVIRESFVSIESSLQLDSKAISNVAGSNLEAISANQYATDFEGFLLGDVTDQSGWFGQFGNWVVDDTNPFGKSQQLRSASDGLGTTLAFSPEVAIGTEPVSSVVMQVNLAGTGVTWDIIPQSNSTAQVNTVLRFGADGSIGIFNIDVTDNSVLTILPIAIPEGYFELGIEVVRATSEFSLSFDGVEVFSGQGFAGNIEQLVFRSLMEVTGPVMDVDNIQLIDGEIFDSFISLSPTSGVLTEGETANILVSFDAQNVESGVYTEDLVLTTNDPALQEVIIPATLNVLSPPGLTINPGQLEFTLIESQEINGEPGLMTVEVINTGDVGFDLELIASSSSILIGVQNSDSLDSVIQEFISPNDTVLLDLTVLTEGFEVGVQEEFVTFTSFFDPENPELLATLPVDITILSAPVLSVDPSFIAFTVIEGQEELVSSEVVISNLGEETNLVFTGYSSSAFMTFGNGFTTLDEVVLAPGDSIQLELNVDPSTLTEGELEEAFFIVSNDPFTASEFPIETSITVLPEAGAVTGFKLFNVANQEDLGAITDGDSIDINLGLQIFTLEALTFPEEVGSVVFELDGKFLKTENSAPYAAAGDINGVFDRLRLNEAGSYTLTATPYSRARGRGDMGQASTITFTLFNSERIARFDLIDVEADQSVRELTDGSVIDLADEATDVFSIEAIAEGVAAPDQVGSVLFELNGKRLRVENFLKYSASGERRGGFRPLNIGKGDFVLTATPYSQINAEGVAGESLTVSFSVINSDDNQAVIGAFPNPLEGSGLTISLPEATDEEVTVQIQDLEGRIMYNMVNQSAIGRSYIQLDDVTESTLQSGVYLLKVYIGNEVSSVRLLRN